jgi:predicted DNA-binding helix-hairpin-helix protein
MFYNQIMDELERLHLLSDHMALEFDQDCGKQRTLSAYEQQVFISDAVMPNGRTLPVLKTLLNSACERNCNYCPFRAGRDFQRVLFKPDEFAKLFMDLYHNGACQGLFLSSGILGGGMRTQDKLLDTAEILRFKLGFRGYIHLKIMPGSEKDQVLRGMQLADRVSINLEGPNPTRLARLAPLKKFDEELLKPLYWVEELRRSLPSYQGWGHRWPSTTTQFVVGAVEESDLELLSVTEQLNRQVYLQRAYYSAFHPISDTPLAEHAPTPLVRQNRLYEASFLLRDYGFDLEEMPFEPTGNLPQDEDPKLAWANANLRQQPIDLNRADRLQLLRVPGIGSKGAEAILRARQQSKLSELGDLTRLGISAKRAAAFVLLNGKRPDFQPRLF